MRKYLVLFLVGFVLSCTNPISVKRCKSQSSFCDGTVLLVCTESGYDAVPVIDCYNDINSLYGNTPQNPLGCFETACDKETAVVTLLGTTCCRHSTNSTQ